MAEVWLSVGLFLIGIGLITWGADALIDGIRDLSRELKLSGVILAILVMGVDLEETIASISAATNGLQDIAIGNVIGNSIISMSFSFAIPGLFHDISFKKIKPVYLTIMLVTSVIVFLGIALWNQLKLFSGLALVAYGSFVAWNLSIVKKTKSDVLRLEEEQNVVDLVSEADTDDNAISSRGKERQKENDGEEEEEEEEEPLWQLVSLAILGILAIYFGSSLLISGTENILTETGVQEGFFGVVIVAAATNVEEYTLLFKSIKKKSVEIGLGAMIGKVVWNLGITFGISVLLLQNISSPSRSIFINAIIFSFVICPIFVIIAAKAKVLNKKWAVLLLGIFTAYLLVGIMV